MQILRMTLEKDTWPWPAARAATKGISSCPAYRWITSGTISDRRLRPLETCFPGFSILKHQHSHGRRIGGGVVRE